MANDPDGVARLNAVNARRLPGSRTTEVWDATMTAEATGKLMTLFRCTQIILWPKG